MCSTRIYYYSTSTAILVWSTDSNVELREGARTEHADNVYMHAVSRIWLDNFNDTQNEIMGGWSGDDVGVVIVVERIFYFGKRLIREDKSKLGVRWFASSAWMCVSRLGGEGARERSLLSLEKRFPIFQRTKRNTWHYCYHCLSIMQYNVYMLIESSIHGTKNSAPKSSTHTTEKTHMSSTRSAPHAVRVDFFSPNYGIYNFIWNAWAVHVLSNGFLCAVWCDAKWFGPVGFTFSLHIGAIFYLEICVWVFVRTPCVYRSVLFSVQLFVMNYSEKNKQKWFVERENSNKRNVKRTNFIQLVSPIVRCVVRCLCDSCVSLCRRISSVSWLNQRLNRKSSENGLEFFPFERNHIWMWSSLCDWLECFTYHTGSKIKRTQTCLRHLLLCTCMIRRDQDFDRRFISIFGFESPALLYQHIGKWMFGVLGTCDFAPVI